MSTAHGNRVAALLATIRGRLDQSRLPGDYQAGYETLGDSSQEQEGASALTAARYQMLLDRLDSAYWDQPAARAELARKILLSLKR